MARLFQVEPARQALLDTAAREAAIFRLKTFIGAARQQEISRGQAAAPTIRRAARRASASCAPTFPDADRAPGDDELTSRRGAGRAARRAEKAGAAAARATMRPASSAGRPSTGSSPAAHAAVADVGGVPLSAHVDHEDLVPLRRPDPELPNLTEGPPEHRRRRDGFGLTDPRMSPARGRERGRLLPVLPRAREGLLLEGDARQVGRGEDATRWASRCAAARWTRRSARCTSCARTATRSRRWR